MLLQARPSLVSSVTRDGNTCAHIAALKGIYNRLALIMSFTLDMDLDLYGLLRPSEMKFNKPWLYDSLL